ncbi:MAG: GTP-binding protein, partial [Leptolyngbyaceae cyanobacterium RM1_406_9]|nr:GTP-binding protein [Leptolyngbyaceae cyanobacterium RM1_406_9]
EAAFKQIAYGDVTILNKTDLADPDQIQNLEAYIHTVKEGARILHSQHGKVPLPLLLDVGYNNPEAYANLIQEEIEQTQQDHSHEAHHHDHDHHAHDDHHDHTHHPHEHYHHHSAHLDNDGFVSVAFESDRPFDVKKFETFLQEQLPKEVFRAKGILWFKESDLRNVFQLSGPRFDLQGEEWRSAPKNQLVFIGRNLNADTLQQHLADCLA